MVTRDVRTLRYDELTADQRRRLSDGRRKAAAARRAQENMIAAAKSSRPRFAELARWIVGTCKPGLELRIQEELSDAGIECWCPVEWKKRPSRRGLKAVEIPRPLFRGYVFVRVIPAMDAYAGVLSASRISALMGRDGKPELLSERLMKLLRLRAAKRSGKQGDSDGKPWWQDRKATVTHGPFAGFTATLRSLVGTGDMIAVEVAMFGRMTPVTLDVDSIAIRE